MESYVGQIKNNNKKKIHDLAKIKQEIKHSKKIKKNAVKDSSLPSNNDTRLPYSGSIKQFASGRGALSGFDWRAYGAAVVLIAPSLAWMSKKKKQR
ncbi:hypothetical protein MLD38_028681 [Melastoma candidum]|uniref:Uncharacterized protein n=1 Tax=Melastoma candidum TaxID=119954 RepID=A0ACB9N2K3_9MYRT|nr:hypothetical protein MLD38_028681 [Melastoma candidum]